MKLYAFRVIVNKSKPKHFGIVAARDMDELFWLVDEFVDPYACEFAKMNSMGLCVLREKGGYSEPELTERFEDILCDKKTKWVKFTDKFSEWRNKGVIPLNT